MPVLWTKTFDHAGRTFEVRAETYHDPSYLEAVAFEAGSQARLSYPGDVLGLTSYGVRSTGTQALNTRPPHKI
jgi:hypothetical protein